MKREMPLEAMKAAIRSSKTPLQLKRALRRKIREIEGSTEEKAFQIEFCQFLQKLNKKNRGTLIIPELKEIRFRDYNLLLGFDVAELTKNNELISYEIKVGGDQSLYSGIGQAVKNLLYSHKSYLIYGPTESTFTLSEIKHMTKEWTPVGLYVFSPVEPRIKFHRKLEASRNKPGSIEVKRQLQSIKRIIPKLKNNPSKFANWGYKKCCTNCQMRFRCRTVRKSKS